MMTPTKRRTGSLSKTARLLVLQRMSEAGSLESMSKASLAKLLDTSRFTIYRDIEDLDKLQPIYRSLLKKVEQS